MSLDVGLVESVVDLQSIVPSIALATFFLSGLTVRIEVKEQGKELKNAMPDTMPPEAQITQIVHRHENNVVPNKFAAKKSKPVFICV